MPKFENIPMDEKPQTEVDKLLDKINELDPKDPQYDIKVASLTAEAGAWTEKRGTEYRRMESVGKEPTLNLAEMNEHMSDITKNLGEVGEVEKQFEPWPQEEMDKFLLMHSTIEEIDAKIENLTEQQNEAVKLGYYETKTGRKVDPKEAVFYMMRAIEALRKKRDRLAQNQIDEMVKMSKSKNEKINLPVDATGLFSAKELEGIVRQADTVKQIDRLMMEYADWREEILKEGAIFDEKSQQTIPAQDAAAQIDQILEALRKKRQTL